MAPRRRMYADELEDRKDEAPEPAQEPGPGEPEPAEDIADLQQNMGNAALARLLQRDVAPGLVRPDSPLSVRGPGLGDPLAGLTSGVMADYSAAMDAVYSWFDQEVDRLKDGGGSTFIQSVAELVAMASGLNFTGKSGKQTRVGDVVKPNELEIGLRERAKVRGVKILEHRAMSDTAGVKSETLAILSNLGAKIPTEVEFGGDDASITASISGKVSAQAGVGAAKFEAEGSPEGASASVSVKGAKLGVDLASRGLEAEIKAGELVTVKGKLGKEADGSIGWKAQITIGTLGRVASADEIAKVMKGAEETFSKSAGELARGLDDPEALKTHGGALKDAVTDVVEKAKKSASQAKPGWSLGLEAKGTDAGGVSGSVTLTWVF